MADELAAIPCSTCGADAAAVDLRPLFAMLPAKDRILARGAARLDGVSLDAGNPGLGIDPAVVSALAGVRCMACLALRVG